MSVIGVSTDGDKSSEEASSTPVVAKTKKNAESLAEVSNVSNVKAKKVKSPASSLTKDKPKKHHSSPAKSTKGTTDNRLEAMDLKWSEIFSRLEAMLLSKTLSQPEPSFQPVKATPVKPPPAGATEKVEPFFAASHPVNRPSASQKNPTDRPQHVDQPLSSDQLTTDPTLRPMASSSSVLSTQQQSDPEMDTDIASDSDSLPDITDKCEEGELSDLDQYISLTDTDQTLSEEQNYRETMHGIMSYMGWSHIPDVDSALANSEDNLFATPKQQPAGKISIQLPTDNWLCRKMDRLNLTLTQGYPSKGSDACGLQHDQFIKPAKSQGKWYGLHPNQIKPTGSVSFWHSDTARLPDLQVTPPQPHPLVTSPRIPLGSGRKVLVKLHTCVIRLQG